MRYTKRHSSISKKQKMFSKRDQILKRGVLTSDEILELFGNEDKIIESEVIFDDNNLYAYFLLEGGFFVDKRDIVSINPQLPDYIPHEERDILLKGLAEAKDNIDAREYDVVEVVCEYRNESEKTFYESDKQITSIGGTQHFIAAPVYTVYYYNIMMTGYTGYEEVGKDVMYEKKNTILGIYKLPHYDVPVYIKFIGDILNKAEYTIY